MCSFQNNREISENMRQTNSKLYVRLENTYSTVIDKMKNK